jgi:hypothetical protein
MDWRGCKDQRMEVVSTAFSSTFHPYTRHEEDDNEGRRYILFQEFFSKSIYYIEENANVVVVGTDISFKICHGKKPFTSSVHLLPSS